MGHWIQALIGRREVFEPHAERLGPPAPTELAGDLVIVPMFGSRFDTFSAGGADHGAAAGQPRDGFVHLTARLERGILSVIGSGSALYIETRYLGGTGSQGAALLSRNGLVWAQATDHQPRSAGGPDPSPINRGLIALGVVRAPRQDEFDTVGLARYRSLDKLGVPEDDDD